MLRNTYLLPVALIWPISILGALCYGATYLVVWYAGWLVGLWSFYWFIQTSAQKKSVQLAGFGLFYGAMLTYFFGTLLRTHVFIHSGFGYLVLLLLTLYYSFFSLGYFHIIGRIFTLQKPYIAIVAIAGYWYVIAFFSLWWVTVAPGLFFLNPFLPVMSKKYSITAASKRVGPFRVCHIAHKKSSLQGLNAYVYKKLSDHAACADNTTPTVIVSGESFYTKPLGAHDHCVRQWQSVMSEHCYYLFGGIRTERIGGRDRVYQTIYLLTKKRIINLYDKKNCVSFFEKIPQCVRFLVKTNNGTFSPGSKKEVLTVANTTLSALICADMFYESFTQPTDYCGIFLNDSWFKNQLKTFFVWYLCWRKQRGALLVITPENCLCIS